MTADILKQRISEAAEILKGTANTVKTTSSSLTQSGLDLFKNLDKPARNIQSVINLIETREHSCEILRKIAEVENQNTDDDTVLFFPNTSYPFEHARKIGYYSYLMATWAVSDAITATLSPLTCSTNIAKNESKPAKLWEHFL